MRRTDGPRSRGRSRRILPRAAADRVRHMNAAVTTWAHVGMGRREAGVVKRLGPSDGPPKYVAIEFAARGSEEWPQQAAERAARRLGHEEILEMPACARWARCPGRPNGVQRSSMHGSGGNKSEAKAVLLAAFLLVAVVYRAASVSARRVSVPHIDFLHFPLYTVSGWRSPVGRFLRVFEFDARERPLREMSRPGIFLAAEPFVAIHAQHRSSHIPHASLEARTRLPTLWLWAPRRPLTCAGRIACVRHRRLQRCRKRDARERPWSRFLG
jgi:hypothetical protein